MALPLLPRRIFYSNFPKTFVCLLAWGFQFSGEVLCVVSQSSHFRKVSGFRLDREKHQERVKDRCGGENLVFFQNNTLFRIKKKNVVYSFCAARYQLAYGPVPVRSPGVRDHCAKGIMSKKLISGTTKGRVISPDCRLFRLNELSFHETSLNTRTTTLPFCPKKSLFMLLQCSNDWCVCYLTYLQWNKYSAVEHQATSNWGNVQYIYDGFMWSYRSCTWHKSTQKHIRSDALNPPWPGVVRDGWLTAGCLFSTGSFCPPRQRTSPNAQQR